MALHAREKTRIIPQRRLTLTGNEIEERLNGTRRRSLRAGIFGFIFLLFIAGFSLLHHWLHAHHTVAIDRTLRKSGFTSAKKIETNPRHRHPISHTVKYLAYYPHGGFHTRRLALENALTLCRLLDRTLLLPPLWIGRQLPWHPRPLLQHGLGNSTKITLGRCRSGSESPECDGYNEWSQVSWDWLVNLEMADVEWVDRWVFREEWLYLSIEDGGLGLVKEDVYNVNQETEFNEQITESEPVQHPRPPYVNQIFLNDIRDLPNRLLHFDSLSGTDRLLLTKDNSKWIRNEVRSSIVIANDLILGPAMKIAGLLSKFNSGHIGVDARIDGELAKSAGTNMRAAWWELGRRNGIPEQELKNAETGVWSRSPAWRVIVTGYSCSIQTTSTLHSTVSSIPCPRLLHSKTPLLPLNTPIFLSTSSNDPQSHAALRLFYSTYPCLFTLDTPEIRRIVNSTIKKGLVNKLDGYDMSGWIENWIALEVTARGREMVGTNSTAWGKWAEEIVQPIAKGWDPVFRD